MRKRAIRLRDIPSDFMRRLQGCSYVKPTMGSDPEFFVADSKGKILASDKFFPGKKKPIIVSGDHKDLKLFFDGIQAELNIPPTACRESVSFFIREALVKAQKIIGEDHHIVLQPSVKVSQKVLNEADPEARIFGCMPDFNAYTLGQNTCEMDASRHLYRYAGGHIHIGMSSVYNRKADMEYKMAKTEEGHIRTIKFIDYITGAILVMLDKGADSKRRRTKYGTAGCFRPTPYGVEYRTPSCWWMKSPTTMSLAFGMVRLAWNMLISNIDEELIKNVGYSQEDVRGIVDESDTVAAKKFWQAIRPYVSIASKSIHNPLNVKSIRTPLSGFVDENKDWKRALIKGKMPFINGGGEPTYALAAFEYILKHGIKGLIDDDVSNEWLFGRRDQFYNVNGFVSGMYSKLSKNTDFKKFQTDFLLNIL